MKKSIPFLMAGGGTGGHVIPALAVAHELQRRGHAPFFIGTKRGIEARLVTAAGFPIEWIEIGGIKGLGAARRLRTMAQLPSSVLRVFRIIGARHPAAVFSMGGYVAAPVMAAAYLRRLPSILMEPNAVAGMTNRWMGKVAERALVSFEETTAQFPAGVAEVTGLPVRAEFFAVAPKAREDRLTLLITGGSRGSHRLNQASRESWPLFRKSGQSVRILHQSGADEHAEMAREFDANGLDGEVKPFIEDMPSAFEQADLVVCRSGAGAVSELAAAGRPAILVPFPFAADQHQLRNAEAMVRAGAARLVEDRELTGARLFQEVTLLTSEPGLLESMARAARSLARPGAAVRAADILEELAGALTEEEKAGTIRDKNVF
jgi:UDP-N-acetylglucosamine--N-acetylmuramyl-(pentapeptide) pyrophosphoryl-undecaprenol N-acetylglucosamine transferase